MTTIKDFKNIKEEMIYSLQSNRNKDKERGMTSIGPHRDDFLISINGIDAKSFGSQGQQRTAVLTIKLSSLEIIKSVTSEYPVLLLDDVLSELDLSRKKYILNSIKKVQTIITCTGMEDIKGYITGETKIFNVKEGIIT
jgi:DNA replication and repair protein RecF